MEVHLDTMNAKDADFWNSRLSIVAEFFGNLNSDAKDAATKPRMSCSFASQNKQWINALIYSSELCSPTRYELQLDKLKSQVVHFKVVLLYFHI